VVVGGDERRAAGDDEAAAAANAAPIGEAIDLADGGEDCRDDVRERRGGGVLREGQQGLRSLRRRRRRRARACVAGAAGGCREGQGGAAREEASEEG